MENKKLTRTYIKKEVLCDKCKTKKFKTAGEKKKYGLIVVHEKNCSYLKKLLRNRMNYICI